MGARFVQNTPMPAPSLLGQYKPVMFVAATDARRAKEFYGETLGLRFVSEDNFAVVFDVNGIMLRVSLVQQFTPAKHTVLGWEVPDIATVVRQLKEAGVELQRYGFPNQDELGIWTAPGGAKIAWFRDPDENILSLTEF